MKSLPLVLLQFASQHVFSAIAMDYVHGQENTSIKGESSTFLENVVERMGN